MRKKPTRKELEERLNLCSIEAGRLHCLLNDMVNGECQWFGGGNAKFRVGVARPCAADGGILVVSRRDDSGHGRYSSAYNLEQYVELMRAYSGDYEETMEVRRLVLECAWPYALRCWQEQEEAKAALKVHATPADQLGRTG